MPSLTLPEIPHYVADPPTQESLDFADLAVIDLSKSCTPEGRVALTREVHDALRIQGFFYVVNHGWSKAQVDRIFDVADHSFTSVELEEKRKLAFQPEQGSYLGYKLPRYWEIESKHGTLDQVEHYSINKDMHQRAHPEPLQPLLPEIEAFIAHNQNNILLPLLRLLAASLELPENTFADMHKMEDYSESATLLEYPNLPSPSYPRSEDEEQKTKNVRLKGHTDYGSLTLLWSQPVGGLQVLSSHDGKWRWVRHIDNALVINGGDALNFFSGGYYTSTIHRVVQPPADQRERVRLGVFFFCMPSDGIRLAPLGESPVLRREGLNKLPEGAVIPLVEDWRKGRSSQYGRVTLKQSMEDGVEEDVVAGVVVRQYN
ncbi:Clavaminate synthase-like protein [Coniophora puteana RWD-64-598 SS2]|uniref:Clavaminate synthase-like protein n=1 Tax=Coniophora puteana (strain RWD-64-598) TaxID=741705 RepID=A0A5M3MK32_CONPW|nr:Clavaminate synthase-like protein [Coniophora puteana RWD-64-598 SS2]EIW79589.1 Clavaminate synthase-like protein [Coniophora puteana RWD-64-598 SS2]